MEECIKGFISYSWENEKHSEWVQNLCNELNNTLGIKCTLDKNDLLLGDDIDLFMEQNVAESDFIIFICSDKSIERAKTRYAGVGRETRLMVKHYDKIIPIFKNNTAHTLPDFLSGKLYLDFDSSHSAREDANKIDELVNAILKKYDTDEPSFNSNKQFKNEVEIISVLDEEGNPAEAEVLAVFSMKNSNKKYIIYAIKNEEAKNGLSRIYAAALIENDGGYYFERIENENEWKQVKEVMFELSKD